MTIAQKLEQMLFERGMFANDAHAVVEAFKRGPMAEAMAKRWDDDIEGYLHPTLAALWMGVRDEAVKWADANCPEAWYRQALIDEQDKVPAPGANHDRLPTADR